MSPKIPSCVSTTLVRAVVPPAVTTVLGAERMSQRLRGTLGDLLAWAPGAGLLPAFCAAEMFRNAGFAACVVDAAVTAYFIASETCETRLTGRPHVIVGAPGRNCPSDHAAVLVQDTDALVLFDPALSRLRHRAFPALAEMCLAATHDDVAAAFNAYAGDYKTAVEWLQPAPRGGIVKFTWGVMAGTPSWADSGMFYERTAKATMPMLTAARRTGHVLEIAIT